MKLTAAAADHGRPWCWSGPLARRLGRRPSWRRALLVVDRPTYASRLSFAFLPALFGARADMRAPLLAGRPPRLASASRGTWLARRRPGSPPASSPTSPASSTSRCRSCSPSSCAALVAPPSGSGRFCWPPWASRLAAGRGGARTTATSFAMVLDDLAPASPPGRGLRPRRYPVQAVLARGLRPDPRLLRQRLSAAWPPPVWSSWWREPRRRRLLAARPPSLAPAGLAGRVRLPPTGQGARRLPPRARDACSSRPSCAWPPARPFAARPRTRGRAWWTRGGAWWPALAVQGPCGQWRAIAEQLGNAR